MRLKDNVERKIFATKMRLDLHERLRCESIRSKKSIQSLVEVAVDRFIPRDVRVVVGKPRRSATTESQIED
jgi:hypothetical protein